MLHETKTVEVCQVHKSFGGRRVVDDISFDVKSGEVFGMVGPNGAGKTTTIRMMMDIIKPDSGGVKVLGDRMRESTKDRIGYLPEERGLYRQITVTESLEYLAQLKGLAPSAAKSGADNLLHRVGMFQHKDKKIEQLSRGMGQIIQFVTTIVHNPDLVILDEPFAGLDPVNREMLKELIRELRQVGKTIILSTHQMNEVEELCDRVLMINKGKAVLYGGLSEIRSRFRNNSIFLEYTGSFDGLAGVTGQKNHGKFVELFLDGKTSSQEVLAQLLARDITVHRFEVSTPSLNEIFIQIVKEE
jgi:ABC-2 type transport system ATP-binding protein